MGSEHGCIQNLIPSRVQHMEGEALGISYHKAPSFWVLGLTIRWSLRRGGCPTNLTRISGLAKRSFDGFAPGTRVVSRIRGLHDS